MGTKRKEKKTNFGFCFVVGEEVMVREDSVGVKLVAEMEEKASRLTREAAGGSEGKVGGNQ